MEDDNSMRRLIGTCCKITSTFPVCLDIFITKCYRETNHVISRYFIILEARSHVAQAARPYILINQTPLPEVLGYRHGKLTTIPSFV